ncbi:hypothetical protein BCR33DRAFT_797105 [Rhizoclosmatium globosum]|uniref:Uncharacterized protein n=1 Tax=Rhizoclosmatium globosum TaxID=329046 RepID=A0A1Y2AIX1_9FUNG|nr:hypothetical protein BCR33DRAFT_797105 [Rhizoclosmatium globosum]|eukprot:ORY22528.1 hypothetical protein BCR33DRAFT_797105 [Rhizoclosmatium globosum]
MNNRQPNSGGNLSPVEPLSITASISAHPPLPPRIMSISALIDEDEAEDPIQVHGGELETVLEPQNHFVQQQQMQQQHQYQQQQEPLFSGTPPYSPKNENEYVKEKPCHDNRTQQVSMTQISNSSSSKTPLCDTHSSTDSSSISLSGPLPGPPSRVHQQPLTQPAVQRQEAALSGTSILMPIDPKDKELYNIVHHVGGGVTFECKLSEKLGSAASIM